EDLELRPDCDEWCKPLAVARRHDALAELVQPSSPCCQPTSTDVELRLAEPKCELAHATARVQTGALEGRGRLVPAAPEVQRENGFGMDHCGGEAAQARKVDRLDHGTRELRGVVIARRRKDENVQELVVRTPDVVDAVDLAGDRERATEERDSGPGVAAV